MKHFGGARHEPLFRRTFYNLGKAVDRTKKPSRLDGHSVHFDAGGFAGVRYVYTEDIDKQHGRGLRRNRTTADRCNTAEPGILEGSAYFWYMPNMSPEYYDRLTI